jgi:transcriptional regulatory protein RtcR
MSRKKVVIGLLGTQLDSGHTEQRWTRWRPTVGICLQPEFPIDRLELLIQPKSEVLAKQVIEDIEKVAPHTEVVVSGLQRVRPNVPITPKLVSMSPASLAGGEQASNAPARP